MKEKESQIRRLLKIMTSLRSPQGCPWDREQSHLSLRYHAVEEVYELMDAIEAGDDHEMMEELGDLLLQVVFHCQLARERGAFDFEQVARHISEKLVRRHPHVFGAAKVKDVEGVWRQWEKIKRAEKAGTHRERPSVFDGIPRHLPALLRVEKLEKKSRRAGLKLKGTGRGGRGGAQLGRALYDLAADAARRGWSAEALLRAESKRRERAGRREERRMRSRQSVKPDLVEI